MIQIPDQNEWFVFKDYKSFQETVRYLCKKSSNSRTKYEARKLRAIRKFLHIPEGMTGTTLYNAIINGGRDYYLIASSKLYCMEALLSSYRKEARKLLEDFMIQVALLGDEATFKRIKKSAKNLKKQIDTETSVENLEEVVYNLNRLLGRF